MLVAEQTSDVLWLWSALPLVHISYFYFSWKRWVWLYFQVHSLNSVKKNTTARQNIVLFYYNNYYVLELTVKELLNGADLIGMDFVLFCFYRRSVYSFFSAGVRRGLSVVWTKQGFRAANSWYGEIYSITSHVGTCEEVEFLPYVICDFCAVPAFSIKACCGILLRGCWRPCTALFSCQHPVRVLY